MKLVFIIHIAVTWALIGLIWTIQHVHYPLFDRVGIETYDLYQRGHMLRIAGLVLPLMLVELITAILLVASPPTDVPRLPLIIAAGGVVVIWFLTIFVNAPQHGQLLSNFDASVHQALVTTNWLRTGIWTVRGVFLGWLLLDLIKY